MAAPAYLRDIHIFDSTKLIARCLEMSILEFGKPFYCELTTNKLTVGYLGFSSDKTTYLFNMDNTYD